MRRLLASCLVVVIALGGGPALRAEQGQGAKRARNPVRHSPDFLKMPPGLYMGEAIGVATNSKGHVFVYTRSANTRLFEFDQNGNYVREIGEGNYGFEFAHCVRVDPQDNIWVVDEGTNMVIKFNPAGRVVMVLGHRPDAVAGAVATPAGPAPPAEKYHPRTPDRCRVGSAGQHFRVGRIHQSPGREVRQERQVPRAGGQREARVGAQPVQHAARDRGRCCKATSTSPTAPTTGCRCSTTTWCAKPSTTTSAIPGRCAFRRARTSTSSRPTPIPTATRRGRGTSPARSTRWNWTGRSSASSAMPASKSAGSRWFT